MEAHQEEGSWSKVPILTIYRMEKCLSASINKQNRLSKLKEKTLNRYKIQ